MALYDKLDTTDEQILAGKRAIAEALLQVGITAVEPNPNNPDSYETFQSYADKVKRLMISNSLILEYIIPSEGFENLTKYKRTLMLPMYNAPVDRTALSIIESDTGYTPSSATISALSTLDDTTGANLVSDTFGNLVWNGSCEMTEAERRSYQDDDASRQTMEYMASRPSTLANDNYSFAVDWGDGSEPCEFVDFETTPEAWYHTYEQPGTYDVSINGVFNHMYSAAGWDGGMVNDGAYVYDKDGVLVQMRENYFTKHRLQKVVAWGNTQFIDMTMCCCYAQILQSIPMLDTTASFTNVTSFESAFYRNNMLSSIPYDSNTLRGLFSNCPLVTSFVLSFNYACSSLPSGVTLPPLLFGDCPEVTTLNACFGTANITGELPVAMFQNMDKLFDLTETFYHTPITGTIPNTLFENCPSLQRLQQSFASTDLSGAIPAGLFKNSPSISNLTATFYDCSGVTAVESGVLSGITADTLNISNAFRRLTSLQDIPDNLLEGVTSETIVAPRVFTNCHNATIPSSLLENMSRCKELRGLASGCVNITSPCPDFPSNGDFDTYSGISKYLGAFARNTSMSGFSSMPAELGGFGERLFPQYHVGMICLDDGTFVEINDYVYDPDNKPIGFCVNSDDDKDQIVAFNGYYGLGTPDPAHQLSATTILPTRTFNPNNPDAIYDFSGDDGETVMRNILSWDTYVQHPDAFPGFRFLEQYQSGTNDRLWFLPTLQEMSPAIFLGEWIYHATRVLIERSEGEYNDDNCYFQTIYRHTTCTRLLYNNLYYYWSSAAGYYNYGSITVTATFWLPMCNIPKN